ncbi:transcription elongation factor GreA [Bradyrhizobium sp. WD16]|uniref:transcription elongation factor GreA n=1 Tax=Bradyrhizobium sp. WD16 TaxID=1521768 RepID=UPI0020A26455|nr:transcription elongation factor GreA [Bradyrhizobium sp. WD16]UTD26803.1 transcription elongation factor GreA [Bradyrhizobium sp. WD16]
MSRAFVKEQEFTDDLPDRPISPHPNDVTPEGLAQIEAEVAKWREAHSACVAADDREGVARTARELRYWSARQATAHVVPPPTDSSQVRFGSTVTIRRDDGREQNFRIVGEDEADPARGTVSHVSPLARALFGREVGEIVKVGAGEAEIIAIR